MSEATDTGVVAIEETTVPKTGTKVRLLGDRLLVMEIEGPSMTRSGIVLPENARERTQRGIVIAVGPGPRSPFTALTADMGISPNDHVMFSQLSGQEMIVDGLPFLVLREADIICVFTEPDQEADDGA